MGRELAPAVSWPMTFKSALPSFMIRAANGRNAEHLNNSHVALAAGN